MKLTLFFLLATALALSVKGFPREIIHQQKIIRQIPFEFDHPTVIKRGDITLTQDSVIFDCKKMNGIYSLAFSYNNIKSVRRFSCLWTLPLLFFGVGLIVEYGVIIKMKTGEEYQFFTFKRKKIIKTIRSKIAG